MVQDFGEATTLKLLDHYTDEIRQRDKEMCERLDGPQEAIQFIATAMKGTAATFGGVVLASAAASLADLCQGGEPEEIILAVERYRSVTQATLSEYEQYRQIILEALSAPEFDPCDVEFPA